MTSGTEWPSATIQYRLNLSNNLYSISPALSALHASRAAALHPEVSAILQPSHCPKCGTYRFSGDHPPKRKRRKRSTPCCRLCGFPNDALLPTNNTTPVPAQLSSKTGTAKNESTVQGPASSNTFTSTPALPSRSLQFHSKSQAKTSTLKDMLSRDRKREETKKAHDKRNEEHKSLVAFLKGL